MPLPFMKSMSTLLGLVLFVSGSMVVADVQLVLNNRIIGSVNAPVSRPDGSGAGAGVKAQLVLVKQDGAVVPLSPSTTFRRSSPAAAYFVNGVVVTVAGVRQGETITLRLRAWEGDDFATSSLRGESKDFEVTNNGGVHNLIGLKEFKLVAQKQPSP